MLYPQLSLLEMFGAEVAAPVAVAAPPSGGFSFYFHPWLRNRPPKVRKPIPPSVNRLDDDEFEELVDTLLEEMFSD